MSRVQFIPHKYPGRIITDADMNPVSHPNRINLDERMICKQLGLERDLLKAFFRHKTMRRIGPCEAAIVGGLCSEDLAAISLASYLIQDFKMPESRGGQIVQQLTDALLKEVSPRRVMVILIDGNRGLQMEIRGGSGTLKVPGKFKKHTTILDAGKLRDEIEVAMMETPLRLPKARSCVMAG